MAEPKFRPSCWRYAGHRGLCFPPRWWRWAVWYLRRGLPIGHPQGESGSDPGHVPGAARQVREEQR